MFVAPLVSDKKKSKRKKFTAEEDARLLSLIDVHGSNDWKLISRLMKDRSPRQCKERYINHLSPELNTGPWTPEEDKLLYECYKHYGSRWSLISKEFKNRSGSNIKNRWTKLQYSTKSCFGTPELPTTEKITLFNTRQGERSFGPDENRMGESFRNIGMVYPQKHVLPLLIYPLNDVNRDDNYRGFSLPWCYGGVECTDTSLKNEQGNRAYTNIRAFKGYAGNLW